MLLFKLRAGKYDCFLNKTRAIFFLSLFLTYGLFGHDSNNSKDYLSEQIFTNNQNELKADSNATLIGHWVNGDCQAVAVEGNLAFMNIGDYLQILDISNPANPIEISKIRTQDEIEGIDVVGSYA